MVSVDRGGQRVFDAEYDYRTRRLAKTEGAETTVYRYDGGTSFQEVQDGVITLELIRGTGMGGGIGSILYTDRHDNSGGGPPGSLTTEYFAYNAVGHTVALTDTSGNVTKTNAYEAFGSVVAETGSSTNNKLANTKERDTSTALDNHGFRYYDPTTGRYVTRDPIGYGDGLNVYLYVGGNPVNRVDPVGLAVSDYKLHMRYKGIKTLHVLEKNDNGFNGVALYFPDTGGTVRVEYSELTDLDALAEKARSGAAAAEFRQAAQGVGAAVEAVARMHPVASVSEAVSGRDLIDPNKRLSAGERAWAVGDVVVDAVPVGAVVGMAVDARRGLKVVDDVSDVTRHADEAADIATGIVRRADDTVGVPARMLPSPQTVTAPTALGRGHTGRFTPRSLKEDLALQQVRSSPDAGIVIPLSGGMNDSRWPASEGWVKMRQNVEGVEIHYLRNTSTGAVDDYKIK